MRLRNMCPAPIIERRPGARFGVITIGGCDPAVREALDCSATSGTPASYMRIRGFPFADSVSKFIEEHEYCYVVEQSRDAQLRTSDLDMKRRRPKTSCGRILSYGGFPLSASQCARVEYASTRRPTVAVHL